MTDIKENLKKVHERVVKAADLAGRDPREITVMAVTKRHPVAVIRQAIAAGQRHFGENFLQEAVDKIDQLGPGPVWHFIGQVQSNKTRRIAQSFSWVHTVDRVKIAQRLSEHRPPELGPLNICLQIKLAEEAGKGGIDPNQIDSVWRKLDQLPGIRVRGLMCIPPPSLDPKQQRHYFSQLQELFKLNGDDSWDTLSMGMSGDLESAVAEGATIVRVGTAIFGPRPN